MKKSRVFLKQITHQEGKLVGRVTIYCSREGKVWDSVGFFNDTESVYKASLRTNDRTWVARNIPSSIWWGMEVHHDWKDEARMYLLTPKEHKIRDRYERGDD